MLLKARNRAVRGELMNKADLIEVLADQTGSTKVDAAKALDAIVDAVSGELAKGGSVSLVGFGTFSVRHRAARDGINPQNPTQKIHIPAANVPVFKAGKALKAAVN
jgi:DNA-binding protein HU-beta|tara:strand:- start:2053 stop:2370 length:318 start_codon:yes stop_codon:yes gene_type:complete